MQEKEFEQVAKDLAQAAYDKKGIDISILAMGDLTSIAEYFVIVSVNNRKQAQSIADEIEDKGAELGLSVLHTEGYREGEWVLVDFGDIICHIFTGQARHFYGLEDLWNDAPTLPFEGV